MPRLPTFLRRTEWWAHALAVGALALLLLVAYGPGYLGYDAAWALLWGEELASGDLPTYEAPIAPTPHPLLNAFAVLAAPTGDLADDLLVGSTYLAYAALGWGCLRLGTVAFSLPVGLVAATIVLTRPLLIAETRQALVDLPFLALVVAAVVVAARRPAAPVAVLGLLALAGLLRPEAWLLSAAYFAWIGARADDRRALVAPAAVAAAAPVLWALSDLVVTGDPMWSLNGTQALAAELDRPRAFDTALAATPFYLQLILGTALAWIGLGGALAALLRLENRAALSLAVGGIGLVTFLVLGLAGLPLLTRYLLLPAVVLAVFCGVAAFGWRSLEPGDGWRRGWTLAGIAALVAMAGILVGDLRDQARRSGPAEDRRVVQLDLRAVAEDPAVVRAARRCARVVVPDYRARPLLSLWLDRRPGEIDEATSDEGEVLVLAYATPRAAASFTTRASIPPSGREALPAGARPLAANGSWLAATTGCR